MTIDEFNEKYKDYLEEGHYGLAINDAVVIAFLYNTFPYLIKHIKGFKFTQIKLKFGKCRFYYHYDEDETSLPYDLVRLIILGIETKINNIIGINNK